MSILREMFLCCVAEGLVVFSPGRGGPLGPAGGWSCCTHCHYPALFTVFPMGCDLPERSTVHVVLPPVESARALDVVLQNRLGLAGDSLTRVDLSASRLPTSSEGLAAVLETNTETESRSHSSFYVFCKTVCRAIQPGKLRVRCQTCKQGTLTLSRGPSCWDDVLVPDRIHGLCQARGCDGRVAEFYLKCGAHPTCDSDTSVALDLITANIRGVPCIACTDVTSPVLVSQCPERHVICLDCFHTYCVTRLQERQFFHDPEIGYSLPCAASTFPYAGRRDPAVSGRGPRHTPPRPEREITPARRPADVISPASISDAEAPRICAAVRSL
ncbi:hypothetical protein COCON_G00224580 [Conger conger]|uniref:E3 ubiquitin-protein ligase parkin n=1 Tax=Conger conger TaxID=82655 RepID=A0A9Q1CWJ1_CONCO|nr:hypothetical protein COCON_G00224580 [Conger conger]